MASDHPKFTTGGSVSNHFAGRGVDIAAIDGVPVNASNFDAREMAMKLQDLAPSIRPDEIGTPWAINGPGYFTDGAHQNHLHIGFDHEISPDFKPPSDVAAPAKTVPRGDTMSVLAPVAKSADVGHESMSFMAAVEPRRGGGAAADAAAQLAAGGNGGGGGSEGAGRARGGEEVPRHAVQVGRLDAADRLRLLRPHAVGVRAGGRSRSRA